MYDFYSKNNIRYSDVSGKIIKILPVLIKKRRGIFVYDNNFFYNGYQVPERNK